jgi:hypothetical protein
VEDGEDHGLLSQGSKMNSCERITATHLPRKFLSDKDKLSRALREKDNEGSIPTCTVEEN